MKEPSPSEIMFEAATTAAQYAFDYLVNDLWPYTLDLAAGAPDGSVLLLLSAYIAYTEFVKPVGIRAYNALVAGVNVFLLGLKIAAKDGSTTAKSVAVSNAETARQKVERLNERRTERGNSPIYQHGD